VEHQSSENFRLSIPFITDVRHEGLNWSLYINEGYAILSVQHKIPRGYFSYQKMFQMRFVYLLEDSFIVTSNRRLSQVQC